MKLTCWGIIWTPSNMDSVKYGVMEMGGLIRHRKLSKEQRESRELPGRNMVLHDEK